MALDDQRPNDAEIGERLRIAREKAEFTQSDAASMIGVARTTIVAIEKGQRRAKISELQILARAFNTSANFLLRKESVHIDLSPQFRKFSSSSSEAVNAAGSLLNQLVSAEIELENALGAKRLSNYPPERPILPGDVAVQAESDAQELRNWLGLGLGPVVDLISLLELQMGIRVFLSPLDSKVSGLFSYDPIAGACILLNSNHPDERIVQSCVHELGHFISTRSESEALLTDQSFQSRTERYATTFGRAFITPSRAVRQMFADLTSGQSHLTRRHIILLANYFGVSREAMVKRLEELSLAKPGTWEWFDSNGGITRQQVEEVLGRSTNSRSIGARNTGPIPQRVALLAREASKRDLYSEGQLCQLLGVDLVSVRELLDGIDDEVEGENEQIQIPR